VATFSDVLVCGGVDDRFTWLPTCTLYTGDSVNKWTPFTPLPTAIAGICMLTLLEHVYVFGGMDIKAVVYNNVYTFDADKSVWSGRANMPQPLMQHSAVVMVDTNQSLVCGGQITDATNSTQSACYMYSATQDVWTAAANMNTARNGHGMAVYKCSDCGCIAFRYQRYQTCL
jgi:N-acetylneuraminic acid mutarotase